MEIIIYLKRDKVAISSNCLTADLCHDIVGMPF